MSKTHSIQIADNVFVKMMAYTDVGESHEGHAHEFDHITLLATGSVRMIHDNGEAEYTAPHLIVTPKGIAHQFITTSPNTVLCCIHAIRDGSTVDDVASQDITPEEAWNLLEAFPLVQKQSAQPE